MKKKSFLSLLILSLFLLFTLGIYLAPAEIDAYGSCPFCYGWAIADKNKTDLINLFAEKQHIKDRDKIKFNIGDQVNTKFEGRMIKLEILIEYGNKNYIIHCNGKRYWFGQYSNWQIVSVKLL